MEKKCKMYLFNGRQYFFLGGADNAISLKAYFSELKYTQNKTVVYRGN